MSLSPKENRSSLCEKAISRYVKAQLSLDNHTYQTLFDVIRQFKNDSIDVSFIGEYEFQILKRVSNANESITLVLDSLIEFYQKNGCQIRQSIVLLEKSKILSNSSICNSAIDLLKSEDFMADEPLKHSAKEELAIAYVLLGILESEGGNYDAKPFRMALGIWKRLLSGVPSFSLDGNSYICIHRYVQFFY